MKKVISVLLLVATIFTFALIPISAAGTTGGSNTLENWDGEKIGVLTGSIHDQYAKRYFPDAEILYFSSISDVIAAVNNGIVDGFFQDVFGIYATLSENDRLTYINDPVDVSPTAFALPKSQRGEEIRILLDEYISKIEEDGTMASLKAKWLTPELNSYDVDISDLQGYEKTIEFATSCSGRPCTYYYNGKPSGYEIELIAGFCREYGFNLNINVTDFAGIIPGLVSGKYDIGADIIVVTEERAQSVLFSKPTNTLPLCLVVKKDTSSGGMRYFTTVGSLQGEDVNLGIVVGMSTDELYKKYFPNGTIKYYNTMADVLYALSVGQVDCFLDEAPLTKYIASQNPGFTYIDELVGETIDTGFVIGDSDFDKKLKADIDEFITKSRVDGVIDEIMNRWIGPESESQRVVIPTNGDKGVIKVAACAQATPSCFIKNNEFAGYEFEILAKFATEYGYGLEIVDMDFSGIIGSIQSGKCDIGCCCISITPERQESVTFTAAYTANACLLLVRQPYEKTGFFEGLKDSFYKTFIKESRWKLIVEGIKTTIIISICSVILGTILGFGLCLLRRIKNKTTFAITSVYIRLFQGTPLLVVLMIFYYIIFAKSGVSGEFVAIISFALNFAAYVCEMFRTGIDGVDEGQTEAALALGYTKQQAFFKIVLPQAATRFLPVYKGEFISLVKMTSIVGYIAVQDITKMSDIIRSCTYEAFFPLIATAIIYFIISWALMMLLKAIEIKVEPNRKKRTVKGVKM